MEKDYKKEYEMMTKKADLVAEIITLIGIVYIITFVIKTIITEFII